DETHFLSLSSKTLSKKDLQRLQRSVELQIAISENTQKIVEALKIINKFIEDESLHDRNNCVPSKKKNRKSSRPTRNNGGMDESVEETTDERKIHVAKRKGKKAKRRSRHTAASEDSEDSYDNEQTPSSLYGSTFSENVQEVVQSSLPLSARPTHFLAVCVRNKEILDRLSAVQRELVSREPLLEKGAFAPEIFHLTLFTLGLDSSEDIENCVQALRAMKRNGLDKFRTLKPVIIHGMSQFYNRAIFAKVKFEQDFIDFREHMKNELGSFNVEIRDMYEKFNPHLTIIKVKRPERKLFGSRNIQPAIYSQFKDVVFGEQTVDDIHLCSMDGQRREDGFYVSLFEINL
ncbi:hypothetical protein EGW08_008318, partial [Elysia chlorotica]